MTSQAAKPIPFPQIQEETVQRLSDHAAQLAVSTAANEKAEAKLQPLQRWFKRAA